MKKTMLAIAAFAGITTAANAQVKISPEIGINLSTMKSEIDFMGQTTSITSDRLTGFKAGVMFDIPVAAGFSVEPGIMYSGKGGKYDDLDTKMMVSYLEVPINLKYAYDLGMAGKVFAHVGPYLGYAIAGNVKDDNGNSEKINFGSDIDEMKPFDLGLNFGIGYQIPMGLYFRAQYGLGLANLSNVSDSKTTNNSNIGLSVGFQF